eukprot:1058713-Prymnesium_polylepis.1
MPWAGSNAAAVASAGWKKKLALSETCSPDGEDARRSMFSWARRAIPISQASRHCWRFTASVPVA